MKTRWVSLQDGRTVVGERDGKPYVAYTNAENIDAVMDRINDHYGQIVENGEWPLFEDWMVDDDTPAPPSSFRLRPGHTCVGKLWLNDNTAEE